MSIEVQEEMCTGCACCVLVCPEEAVDNRPFFVARIDEALCTECLVCIESCPTQALKKN